MKTYNEFIAEATALNEVTNPDSSHGEAYILRAFEGKQSDWTKMRKRGYKFFTGNGKTEVTEFSNYRSVMFVTTGDNSSVDKDFKTFGVVSKGKA